jgi:predicted permease
MALGAGRRRLVQQLLTESLVLALAGGLGGWLVAAYLSSLFGLIRVPLGWPLDLSISPDYRLVFFCASLSVLTGMAFGLVPALQATRPDLVATLKADHQRGILKRIRFRDTLVVAQVAICTLLLLGMGLFLHSLQAARAANIGITPRNLLLLAFDPALSRRSDDQSRELLRAVLDEVRRVPGVESATLTSAVPLTLIISNSNFVPAEQAKDRQARRIQTDIYTVGPDFFSTLGMPVLSGEVFAVGPASSAVVNDTFERMAFPGDSAVGRRVVGDGKALHIVGVVATAKSRSISEAPRPAIYLPVLSAYTARELPQGVSLLVKTNGEPAAFARPVREAIRRVDPSLALFDVRSMDSHVESALLAPRMAWALSSVAGLVGLALAIIGVYGVVSYAVARRRRELAVRLAVGARTHQILMMILRQGLGMAAIGVAIGTLAAFALSRFTVSLLYGVGPVDPLTFTAVPTFLIGVAALASLFPARQAASLDPAEVLRNE